MSEPGWVEVDAPTVTLRGLQWQPRHNATKAPVALCLHGFPDTAYGWRRVAPRLADEGWRVVAPFMRGYAPSTIPSDSSYHVGALMDDAMRVLDAVGPTGRDVIIGHDWGAIAGAGLAAMPDSPVLQGGDHVGAAGGQLPSVASRAGCASVGRAVAPAAGPQLVHHVLPAAVLAGAIGVVGGAPALAAVVARAGRQRGPATRRRGDRHTGKLACRTRVPTGRRSAAGGRRSDTSGCISTGSRHRTCPPCTCTATTTAARRPTTRAGCRTSFRPAATSTSSTTPGTFFSSSNRTSSPSTSSTSSGGVSNLPDHLENGDRGGFAPAPAKAVNAGPAGRAGRPRG